MTYATRQDLEQRYDVAEISNLATDPDAPGVDKTVKALADAAAEVDAYVGKLYLLPLPAGDWGVLTDIQCSLALSNLYEDPTQDKPQRERARGMKLLRAIGKGEARLADAGGATPPGRNNPQYDAPDPQFSRDRMRGF